MHSHHLHLPVQEFPKYCHQLDGHRSRPKEEKQQTRYKAPLFFFFGLS